MKRRRPSTSDELATAKRLRSEGWTIALIAAFLGRSSSWAHFNTVDVKPPPIRQRAVRLLRRGFDVPPSKQADFETLRRAGHTTDEIKRLLSLE